MPELVALSAARDAHGAKARNLRWLIEHGFPVPTGVVASVDVPESLIATWVDPAKCYAVRSSASVEDSPSSSFAGQFATVLGVSGAESIRGAIRQVHDSATDPRVLPYMSRVGVALDDVRMRVIVQEMVDAVASGVAFSRNPLTGLTDIVVEATTGTAEDLVAGRATPQRWVWHWGEWIEAPARPATPEPVLREIVGMVERAAEEYGGQSTSSGRGTGTGPGSCRSAR